MCDGGVFNNGQYFIAKLYLLLSGRDDFGPILTNRRAPMHGLGKRRFLVGCVLSEQPAYSLGVAAFPGQAVTF